VIAASGLVALGLAVAGGISAAQELAPGVYVLGSSQKFGAANVGWVVLDEHVLLIGVPHAERLADCLAEVARVSDRPVQSAIVLQVRSGDLESSRALARRGIELIVQRDGAAALRDVLGEDASRLREFDGRFAMPDARPEIEVLAQGRIGGPGDAVVALPKAGILFAGPFCVHGPRAALPKTDTLAWLRALKALRERNWKTVVPGAGTVGGPELLDRQERFLRELRRQVGHLIAQGRPLEEVVRSVQLSPDYLVWMPYDHPTREDVEHVYRELTVPLAPFGGRADVPSSGRPRALVLIGDRPHDPAHLEAGLGRALDAAGVDAFFCVDVRALSAKNLARVQLLVILRDGALWPRGAEGPAAIWMTPEQEQTIAAFVERGGGLLAVHNATGLYPAGGPYLRLLGGTYNSHGPLERFRVNVLDRSHPITRGVADFEVADEQHTPVPDREKVHLLLESRSAEGVVGAAGWAHEVGKGRVAYLANGHTREALENAEYQKLLRNAALWCLGRDVAGGGR
jgi:type 1 glutamine amidotransferase